jgi:hypothetical protein
MTFTDSEVSPDLLNPNVHWCGSCRKWVLDCEHCVEPIAAASVTLRDWQSIDARYDRNRQILELTFNTGDAAQFFNVPRSMAVALVKSSGPGAFYHTEIAGKFRFAHVRLKEKPRGCISRTASLKAIPRSLHSSQSFKGGPERLAFLPRTTERSIRG